MPSPKKHTPRKGKKENAQPPLEEIKVVLKPILGVSPAVYVSAAWAVIAVLAVFLLLILPGIRKNGTMLTVLSLPADASVIVDGVRLGPSGGPLFAPKGERTLVVARPGFEPYERRISVKGRVFASRILPRRESLTAVLKPLDGERPLVSGCREYALWAATGEERDHYAIPPSLTQAARDALASGDGGEGLAEAALPIASDERHLADVLRADFLLSGGGAPLGASSLVSYIDSIAARAHDDPSIVDGIVRTMKEETADALGVKDLRDEAGLRSEDIAKAAVSDAKAVAVPAAARRFFGGIEFIAVPASRTVIGDFEAAANGYNPRSGAYPVEASSSAFFLGAKEISNREFSVFVRENPEWAPDRRDDLIKEGKVDAAYLYGWTVDSPPIETALEPVTGVSWYAAEAYADWFTAKYLPRTALHAVLPREDQWEIAARLNGIVEDTSELTAGLKAVDDADEGRFGLIGMAGNVREWCSNPYRRNENLYGDGNGPRYQDADDPFAAPERTVRGGAYIDGKILYPAAVRGGLRPDVTSPVVGFRLAVVG